MIGAAICCCNLHFAILAQPSLPTEFVGILSYEGEVVFSADRELLIAGIISCAIGPSGEIAILDERQKSIFYCERSGRVRYRIDRAKVDSVLPGYPFSPFNIAIDNAGTIYVQSDAEARGELLRFARDGSYRGKVRYAEFNHAFHFAIDEINLVSYIVERPDRMFLRLTNLSTGKYADFGDFPRQFRNAIYRTPVISLAFGDGKIYQVHCMEPRVYVYDLTGKLLNSFEHAPPNYVRIQRDLPTDFMSTTKKDMAWTSTEAIFLVDSKHVLMQFLDRQQKAFLAMIVRTDGALVLEAVPVPHRVVAAKDGHVYFVKQPEPLPNGELPNPVLLKARFTPPPKEPR
jgi:hypothetical protein